jgi:hypothetical protein
MQGSELDYFIASHRLRALVHGDVKVDTEGLCAPHRRVSVDFALGNKDMVETFDRPRIHSHIFSGPLRCEAYSGSEGLLQDMVHYYQHKG